MQRFEPPAGGTDPVGQGRVVEIDAQSREYLRLSVERQMVAVLVHQNLSDQGRRGHPLATSRSGAAD
jgi:hypothetical protein